MSAGPDHTIELGDSVTLSGLVYPLFGQEVLWTPDYNINCTDCIRPVVRPYETTVYTLTATDPNTGCEKEDDVLVVVEKVRGVFLPNAFSPNGDGINDVFTVLAHQGVKEVLDMKIFDRWGNLIYDRQNFQPNFLKNGWDGSFRGKDMDPAVFAYLAEVEFLDGERIFYKGDVTLVR